MINKIFLVLLCFLVQNRVMAKTDLPIKALGSNDMSKPIIFYISGDGGLNSFSTSFMKQWNSLGYPIVGLNARSYFFLSQSPDAAAKDINALIVEYTNLWKRNNIILLGYSFGADVLPFMQTRLSPDVMNKIKHTVLLSPSHNTDFAVHLFYSKKGGSIVPTEINKLTKPTLIIFGSEENDIDDKEINNRQVTVVKVTGNHHYDNQVSVLVDDIIKRL